MIDFDVVILTPTATTRTARVEEILRRLREDIVDPARALALTFFTDATTEDGLREDREEIRRLAAAALREKPVPVSVVSQAPAGAPAGAGGAGIALEAQVLVGEAMVERRTAGGRPYTVVTAGGSRQVHAGGLGADATGDTTARSRIAFDEMEAILAAEGLGYGHVVRQWNYIERFLDLGANGRQPYQDFNDVRTERYDRDEFPAGYPAATGIGQATGGVVIEFVAVDASPEIEVAPVTNPRQIDAHRYSECVLVGDAPEKTPPKFERAKLVRNGGTETVFVSGTASIIGEQSVAVGDVAAQTVTTLENIGILSDSRALVSLRAYVKRADDIATVRSVCEASWPSCDALYVVADVCREELLVEIEGRARRRPGAET
ncbi:MAG: hypothetical protein ABFS86_09470 [Planctomycetota bacterium]